MVEAINVGYVNLVRYAASIFLCLGLTRCQACELKYLDPAPGYCNEPPLEE